MQTQPKSRRMTLDRAAEYDRLNMVEVLLKFFAKSEMSYGTGFDNAIKFARRNDQFAVARLPEARSSSLCARYSFIWDTSIRLSFLRFIVTRTSLREDRTCFKQLVYAGCLLISRHNL
jgi:hypothetical protein